jgi:hypothetical protein
MARLRASRCRRLSNNMLSGTLPTSWSALANLGKMSADQTTCAAGRGTLRPHAGIQGLLKARCYLLAVTQPHLPCLWHGHGRPKAIS